MLHTAAAAHVSTFQAIVLGLLQGVTELFPVSSLGHTVIFPNLFGWSNIVSWQSQPESPWLAFIVMLHVGSAIGLLVYFWRDWIEIIRAFFATLAKRRIETSTERLAWLIVCASIPTGILGLVLEHPARTATAKPLIASIFLIVNGFILLGAERLRRVAHVRTPAYAGGEAAVPVHARPGEAPAAVHARPGEAPGAGATAVATAQAAPGAGATAVATTQAPPRTEERAVTGGRGRLGARRGRDLETLEYREAGVIGLVQATALIAGISRDGIVMAAGLFRGLDNYDAGRFAFLLATPIILAAGIFKFGDLTGPLGAGIRGAAVLAAAVAAVAAVITVHFLSRYLRRGNLTPFGIYCVVFGVAMVIYNL